MQMTGQRIMYDMRVQIFEHLQNLELKFLPQQSCRTTDDPGYK